MGNHDYQLNPLAQIKYNKNNWTMPNWYFKKTIGNNECWFLDTCQLVTLGNTEENSNLGHVTKNRIESVRDLFENVKNKQLKWLNETLEISTCKKIVFGHYPLVTYGTHQEDSVKKLYDLLFPIFKNIMLIIIFVDMIIIS